MILTQMISLKNLKERRHHLCLMNRAEKQFDYTFVPWKINWLGEVIGKFLDSLFGCSWVHHS